MTNDRKEFRLLRFMIADKYSEPEVMTHLRTVLFPDQDCDSDAPLVDAHADLCAAWRQARLGLIVRCRDWPDLDRARAQLALQPVYDVVHMIRRMGPLDLLLIGFDWVNQERAFNNGYSLYVFRHGSQKHVRRGWQKQARLKQENAHRDLRTDGRPRPKPATDSTKGETLMNRQHRDHTASKQVRQSGPPEACDFCSTDTRPPDVVRQGATATRYLHPSCSEREAMGSIVDANEARRLQGDQGRRGDLRVVGA